MVFESSCWASESSFVADKQSFISSENPIQRQPKVDYFNGNTMNVVPNVSHISSNGYYGYCPATQQSAQNFYVNQEKTEQQINGDNINGMPHLIEQELHKEYLSTECRKRSIDVADNFAHFAKRSRNINEFIEDVHMTEDGLPGSKQRITQCDTNLSMTAPMPNNHEAWTNFANMISNRQDVNLYNLEKSNIENRMPIQQQQLKRKLITSPSLASKQNRNHLNQLNELKMELNLLNSTPIEFNSHTNINETKTSAKNANANAQFMNFSSSIKSTVNDNDDEMENLYWQTHGSMLWYTVGVNNENIDTI